MDIKRKVRLALIVFFSTSVILNGALMVKSMVAYSAADSEYQNISSSMSSMEVADKPVLSEKSEEFFSRQYEVPDFSVDFEELLAINEDCVGWVHIPDIDISYPICRSHDNQEYLKTTFYKKKNNSGCIFTDCRIDTPFKQRTILYGHNMKTGTMFAGLYALEEMEDTSAVNVWIYLPDGTIQCYVITEVTRVYASDERVYDLDATQTELVLSTCVKDDVRLAIICNKAATYI